MPGRLVVLEGIDGAGKSTLAAGLADRLEAAGHRVTRTREPTDGPHGRRIRALAQSGQRLAPQEEFHLFHQDRKLHVADLVRPALMRGDVVVQDRSYFSTIAYQSERGLDPAWIQRESEAIAPFPDLLLVVDLPVELALERLGRRSEPDAFERRDALIRIRDVFLGIPGAVVLDGRLAPAELCERALSTVNDRWPESVSGLEV